MAGERVFLLGVGVDNVTQEEATSRIEEMVCRGKPSQVVTINPEFIIAAQRDRRFREVLRAADLALPDGVGLLWAARYLDTPLKERVTGVDTVWQIAGLAAERGYSLFLLGAAPGVAEEAAERLCRAYPRLMVAGTYAGSPATEEEDAIVERVRVARPTFLFVAYGVPAQDLWIARNLVRLEVPVAMGVGGAFDFISGRAQRAPEELRRLGLEWLHRLYREPWRWRRMLALPRFVWLVATQGARLGEE